MCLSQGPQHSDAGEAGTRGPLTKHSPGGKVYPDTKTAGVKSKFSEKRTYHTIS